MHNDGGLQVVDDTEFGARVDVATSEATCGDSQLMNFTEQHVDQVEPERVSALRTEQVVLP